MPEDIQTEIADINEINNTDYDPFELHAAPNVHHGDDHFASNTLAKIHRRDWSDYLYRYVPRLKETIRYATNPESVNQAVSRTGEAFDRGMETAQGTHQRDLSRYGISETNGAKANRSRLDAIDSTANKTASQNMTRLHVEDLQNKILSGGQAAGLQESRVN